MEKNQQPTSKQHGKRILGLVSKDIARVMHRPKTKIPINQQVQNKFDQLIHLGT